jgi:hypothetical protein
MQTAQAFSSGGSEATAFAKATADAINTYGCGNIQPVLASAPP